ncbi:LysR family transcriptional regulator [Candidatus Nucleicultrix amoebiphila]|jgi:DNA-binding transcriptional LysR family regulator|uniref:LysR family transcriptional regulator n=1 Tax=Candidatus Nucleicultrix amoebiphila TaxID=1509244 RepID=UPI000A268E63|nr:LysR family transcriptional regulator [Candidatus Nucleicultrix amoebiphila]
MDWDKLKQFYYVAKAANFTRAGERLNISQSALSRSVRHLEEHLGTKLFQRNTRGVVLTKQGEILFEQVSHMMTAIQKAQTTIREEESEPSGSLKVASTYGVAALYISPHLPKFIKQYPKIHVTLFGNDIAPDLDLCEADVIIHPHIPNQTNYIQRPLLTVHMGLFASPQYLETHGTPKSLEDLSNHHLIGYGYHLNHPFQSSNWLLKAGMPVGEMREPIAQANSTITRCLLAEEGIGIITIPKEHPGLDKLNLVPVLPEAEGPTIELFYIYSKQLKNSKRVLFFRDYLEGILGRNSNSSQPQVNNGPLNEKINIFA